MALFVGPATRARPSLWRLSLAGKSGSTCPSLLAARLALTTALARPSSTREIWSTLGVIAAARLAVPTAVAGPQDGTHEIWSTLRATDAARLALTAALGLRPRDDCKCQQEHRRQD